MLDQVSADLEMATLVVCVLSKELQQQTSLTEELGADMARLLQAQNVSASAERTAVVEYLRRMADLWDGSARSPQALLRGCAAYIHAGGHREVW